MFFFKTLTFYFFTVFIILHCHMANAQVKDTLFLQFPDSVAAPAKLNKQVSKLKAGFSGITSLDAAAVQDIKLPQVLLQLETDKNYRHLLLIRYWVAFHYRELVPELILRLRNKGIIGLENYEGILIMERIRAGHMKNYGQGSIEKNDLFSLAGRCNWLLTEITGEHFGNVSMYSSAKDLSRLQERWINWLSMLTKSNE